MHPYLLLDAGGTLLFPDFHVIHDILATQGYEIPEARLKRTATDYIRWYDERLQAGNNDEAWPQFLRWILERAGVGSEHVASLAQRLYQKDLERSLWGYTYPWVHEALAALCAAGYRMSVISNADGRVQKELESSGLAAYLERVFDSHVVGYAKPDVRLFEHALAALALDPAECLYVGDVFFIDVLGANRAGIAAVHLDPYNLYTGWEGCHIRDIGALPGFLATPGLDLRSDLFFPLRSGSW